MSMNKLFVALCASAAVLASTSAVADDRTPSNFTPTEQAKLKQEADAKKAAVATMTPEQRAAAREARDAETLQWDTTMVKRIQNPQGASAGIAKSAADSKAGPTPRHGTMNTPEADKVLKEQKGQ
jgi:hypothetical protein